MAYKPGGANPWLTYNRAAEQGELPQPPQNLQGQINYPNWWPAMREFSSRPTEGQPYWTPRRIARYYNALKTVPYAGNVPTWIDVPKIETAYQYLKDTRSSDWQTWEDTLDSDPVLTDFVRDWAPPPLEVIPKWEQDDFAAVDNAVKTTTEGPVGEWTNYGIDYETWQKLPTWKKNANRLFRSMPGQMGQQALNLAIAGYSVGNVPGAVVGAGLGAGLGYLGTVEQERAARMGENYKPGFAYWTMGTLNFLFTQAQQTMALRQQIQNSLVDPKNYGTVGEILKDIPSAYEAGEGFYSLLPYELQSAFDKDGKVRVINIAGEDTFIDAAPKGEFASGLVLVDIRRKLASGKLSPSQVREYTVQKYGFLSEAADLLAGYVLDPLDLIGPVTSGAIGNIADAKGNVALAKSFLGPTGANDLLTGYRQYRQILRQMPVDEVRKMGNITQWFTGLDKQGVDVTLRQKNTGFMDKMFGLAKESRADALLRDFNDGLANMLNMENGNVDGMYRIVNSFSRITPGESVSAVDGGKIKITVGGKATDVDMPRWIQSAEAQIVPLALKDQMPKVRDHYDLYNSTRPQAEVIKRFADALGETPYDLIADLHGTGKHPTDFDTVMRRITALAAEGDKAAADFLKNWKSKDMTNAQMKQIADLFSGENGVAYDGQLWGVQLMHLLDQGAEDWMVKWFGIKPAGWAMRLAGIIKQAQGHLLLGNNPLYLANNAINNVVTMAWEGVLGGMSKKARSNFLRRYGYPSKLRQGIGAAEIGDVEAGVVPGTETGTAEYKLGQRLRAATRAKDGMQATSDLLHMGDKFQVAAVRSQRLERWSSENAMVKALREYWDRGWAAGVGFDKITGDLRLILDAIQPGTADRVEILISRGLNKTEIEAEIFTGWEKVTLKDVLTPEEVNMLDAFPGMMDEIDKGLREATTDEARRTVFHDAIAKAEKQLSDDLRRKVTAIVHQSAFKAQTEGLSGVFDSLDTIVPERHDFWQQHMQHMDDVASQAEELVGLERANLWRKELELADQQWQTFSNAEGAKWLGMFEGLGAERMGAEYGLVMRNLTDVHDVWNNFYQTRRTLMDEYWGYIDGTDFTGMSKEEGRVLRSAKWAEVSEKLNLEYLESVMIEDAYQVDLDAMLVKRYADQIGATSGQVAAQWRDSQLRIRRTMMQAQSAWRTGRVAERMLKEWGALLPKETLEKIALLNNGEPIYRMAVSERDKANKKFYREIYQPLIGSMLDTATMHTTKPKKGKVSEGKGKTETAVEPKPAQEEPKAAAPAKEEVTQSPVWKIISEKKPEFAGVDEMGRPNPDAKLNVIKWLRKWSPEAKARNVKEWAKVTPALVLEAWTAEQAAPKVEVVPIDTTPPVDETPIVSESPAEPVQEASTETATPPVKQSWDQTRGKMDVFERVSNPPETGRVSDALEINLANLKEVWDYYAVEIARNDPKLSGLRAGEIAAARIVKAIDDRIEGIKRSKVQTQEEVGWADNFLDDELNYRQILMDVSHSRTLLDDIATEELASRPLDAEPLPDTFGENNKGTEELKKRLADKENTEISDALAEEARLTDGLSPEAAAEVEQGQRAEAALEHVIAKAQDMRANADDMLRLAPPKEVNADIFREYLHEVFADAYPDKPEVASVRADAIWVAIDRISETLAKEAGMTKDEWYSQFILQRGGDEVTVGDALARMTDVTQSPEFRNWFGDSKVVDENGQPLVVYHGSPSKFETFDFAKLGTNGFSEGVGFYFTDNKGIASGYTRGNTAGLYEVYLSINKPMDLTQKKITKAQLKQMFLEIQRLSVDDPDNNIGLSNYGDVTYEGLDRVLNTAVNLEYGNPTDADMIASVVNGGSVDPETMNRIVTKVTGYDGIVAKWEHTDPQSMVYVAFSPEQIKSVNNRGTYDPTNPNILYRTNEEWLASVDRLEYTRGEDWIDYRIYDKDGKVLREDTIDVTRQAPTVLGEAVTQRIIDGGKAGILTGAELEGLNPGGGVVRRAGGATWWLENGKAVIHAFRRAGVADMLHEYVHAITPLLPDNDLRIIERWYAQEYGRELKPDWNAKGAPDKDVYEKLARGFERYMTEGPTGFTGAIAAVFQKIKTWMLDIYKSLNHEDIDIRLNDEVRGMFDRWLGKEKAQVGEINIELTQGKTRAGKDITVARIGKRVDYALFKTWQEVARKYGGWYDKNNSGFGFREQGNAQAFLDEISGRPVTEATQTAAEIKIDKTEQNAQIIQNKLAKQSQKLFDVADKLEAKAKESLGQDRLANTRKRASQAASATEAAWADIAMARTMRNIAQAIADGEAGHLDKITSKTQIDTLEGELVRAMYQRAHKDDIRMDDGRPPDARDIEFVEAPHIILRKYEVNKIEEFLRGKRGYKEQLNTLRRRIGTSEMVYVSDPDTISAYAALKKIAISELKYISDGLEDYNRLSAIGITTREQLKAALTEYIAVRGKKEQTSRVDEMERSLIGVDIPGYFPTPKGLASELVADAGIEPGMRVLEPSAGKGNIADAIKEVAPDATLDVVEWSQTLANILKEKGYNLIGNDIFDVIGEYDRIVMNPPFEKMADIDHVRKAYELLKPGGRLVSVMSASPFFRTDTKAVEFRNWLDSVGYAEPLPEGSFAKAERSTGVNTYKVVIDKPENGKVPDIQTTAPAISAPATPPAPAPSMWDKRPAAVAPAINYKVGDRVWYQRTFGTDYRKGDELRDYQIGKVVQVLDNAVRIDTGEDGAVITLINSDVVPYGGGSLSGMPKPRTPGAGIKAFDPAEKAAILEQLADTANRLAKSQREIMVGTEPIATALLKEFNGDPKVVVDGDIVRIIPTDSRHRVIKTGEITVTQTDKGLLIEYPDSSLARYDVNTSNILDAAITTTRNTVKRLSSEARGGSEPVQIITGNATYTVENAGQANALYRAISGKPVPGFEDYPTKRAVLYRIPTDSEGGPLNEPPAVNSPLGTADELNGLPYDDITFAGWNTQLRPLLEQAQQRVLNQPRNAVDLQGSLDKQGDALLRSYLGKVYTQLADTKMAANKYAESRRDAALLDYSKKTGIENMAFSAIPYGFWYTHTAINWALRALNKPSILANYYRLQRMQQRHESKDGYPQRLKGKVAIPMPWLPDWMGDSIYVDPMRQLFPILQLAKPFERAADEKNQTARRTDQIIYDMVDNGEITDEQAQEAIETKAGAIYIKAKSQAESEQDRDFQNPFDYAFTLSSPLLPLTWAYKAATGRADEIGQLPFTRLVQNTTAMAGIGGARGVNLEGWIRKGVGLPEVDQYEDYRVNRELSNMVAEGLIDPDTAGTAMIDRTGEAFTEAQRRVSQQGVVKYIGGALALDLFPEGEMRQRGLTDEFAAAYDAKAKGDKNAVNDFFDKYPEYSSRLMTFKEPEEQLRAHLRGIVWDKYLTLPKVQAKAFRESAGDVFEEAFLNSETRSYDSISTDTLAMWANSLGETPEKAGTAELPVDWMDDETVKQIESYYNEKTKLFGEYDPNGALDPNYSLWQNQYLAQHPNLIKYVIGETNALYGLPEEIQVYVYKYRAERDTRYPGIFDTQDAYFQLPSNQRKSFLKSHSELPEYWDWRKRMAAAYPKASPYILSDESLAAEILDEDYVSYNTSSQSGYSGGSYSTATYNDGRPATGYHPPYLTSSELKRFSAPLVMQLMARFYRNEKLMPGAYRELTTIWEQLGKPFGNLEDFIEYAVKPTITQ